jgi:hypothetical protein
MRKFSAIKSKYLSLGVSEGNIDYAIESVVEGSKRGHIIETLTASYRGMLPNQATELLEALFAANGGEFKKENRGGYLFGVLLTLVGITGAVFAIAMLMTGEGRLKFILFAIALGSFGLFKGPALLLKAWRGKYRDGDDPFNVSE